LFYVVKQKLKTKEALFFIFSARKDKEKIQRKDKEKEKIQRKDKEKIQRKDKG